MDEANIAKARETIGSESLLLVDSGNGDAFWQYSLGPEYGPVHVVIGRLGG